MEDKILNKKEIETTVSNIVLKPSQEKGNLHLDYWKDDRKNGVRVKVKVCINRNEIDYELLANKLNVVNSGGEDGFWKVGITKGGWFDNEKFAYKHYTN